MTAAPAHLEPDHHDLVILDINQRRSTHKISGHYTKFLSNSLVRLVPIFAYVGN